MQRRQMLKGARACRDVRRVRDARAASRSVHGANAFPLYEFARIEQDRGPLMGSRAAQHHRASRSVARSHGAPDHGAQQ